MSFRRPACRFVISCRILLCCMAYHASLEIRAAVLYVSLPSLLIVLSRLDTSRRIALSHRSVSSRHVRRYASLDKGGAGRWYHSIIHMGISSKKIPYGFSIRRRYGGISVLPRFSIYHDTFYCVNFLYYDMHIRFRTGSPNRLSGTRS